MKTALARILFAYLTRMGLVLCVLDPDTPTLDTTGDAPSTVGDGAPGGEGGDKDEGGEDDASKDAAKGDATQDERDKLIRKLERRIGNRTKALGARDAELAHTRAELERLRAQGGAANDDEDDDPAPARGKDVDPETRAREIASDMLRAQSVAAKTRGMLDEAKQWPDFREVAADVADELPFVDKKGKPTPFIEAVLEADKPAALLYHLGKNPEVLESLADLTPIQLGRRLAKIEAELKPSAPRRSNAPKPLEPVTGRGNTSRDEAGMSDAEWRADRLAKKKA